eukprot:395455-Prymnesium_polylepis.1
MAAAATAGGTPAGCRRGACPRTATGGARARDAGRRRRRRLVRSRVAAPDGAGRHAARRARAARTA